MTARGFNWTPKRDALLRELRHQGLSLAEAARAIGCDVAHVRMRARQLGGAQVKADDVGAVPRPAPQPSAPRPVGRRPLIDLSKAPSAMEERFAPERFR